MNDIKHKDWNVAVIPTDTVYGIVARVNDRKAIEKVYAIKDRDFSKGCIILIEKIEDIQNWPVILTDTFYKATQEYWPGAVTLKLRINKDKISEISYSPLIEDGLMAFRVPDDTWLRAFIREHGPIIAPSANPAGLPPATTCDMAREYFGDAVDVYIDRGERNLKPSTIIDVSGDELKIIRE